MELKATIQRSRWKANFASWKRARKEAKFLVMAPPTLDASTDIGFDFQFRKPSSRAYQWTTQKNIYSLVLIEILSTRI